MGRFRGAQAMETVSPEGAPIGITAKRRKWRGISKPERRDGNCCRIRNLGGGGDGIRTHDTAINRITV
jgi:hypothetical protein